MVHERVLVEEAEPRAVGGRVEPDRRTDERVVALEGAVRDRGDLLADVDPEGFELLTEFAQPYSLLVMCDLLGAPFEDRHRMLEVEVGGREPEVPADR